MPPHTSVPLLLCLLLSASLPGASRAASAASFSASPTSVDLHRLCPSACLCDAVGRRTHVDCSYAALSVFPPALPGELTRLDLTGNPLGLITPATLHAGDLSHHLEDFQCSDCRLTELESDSFRGFHKLKYIDLSNNDLHDLSTDVFDGLPSLRIIDVRSNERIDCAATVAAFREKLPRVEVLCVSSALTRRRRDDDDTSSSEATADQEVTQEGRLQEATLDQGVTQEGRMREATDPPAPVAVNEVPMQTAEPDSGFGVGTIIFIVVLGIIISVICFKFVFLRLKKRFCRGGRHAEEQPLDSD